MNELEVRRTIESEIQMAFRGITLGEGVSLRQAQSADQPRNGVYNPRSASPLPGEIVDDWSQVTLDELESDCIAHLDAAGFRYYIPALMLSVLDHYDSGSMRVIGTLSSLYPKKDPTWEYDMIRYSLLNHQQKTAIAQFLEALPKLVELGSEHQKVVPRALRNHWGEYLQSNPAK
jgi:hypothetical protein